MHFSEYQQWVKAFYQQQNWYERDVFRRLAYLTEEIGKLPALYERLKSGESALTK